MQTATNDIFALLKMLCPMHAVIDAKGAILQVGNTLAKLAPDKALVGTRFLDVFELVRPAQIETIEQLQSVAGQRLRLCKTGASALTLKGVLVPIGDTGLCVINLSFGISVMEGVREFALTSADFAATDLTVEMLYLIEAKSAAMEASRKLNLRLQGAMIAAEEQAFTDTLTGLKNRRALDMILGRWVEEGRALSLAQMDLDFFKSVNDAYGHAAGDHVLQTVARILVEETRQEDCIARAGGDEFVLVFSGRMDRERLGKLAHRIITRVETPILFREQECRISTSLGFASSDGGKTSPETLLEQADTALYEAKRAGRAQFRIYDQETAKKRSALGLPSEQEGASSQSGLTPLT